MVKAGRTERGGTEGMKKGELKSCWQHLHHDRVTKRESTPVRVHFGSRTSPVYSFFSSKIYAYCWKIQCLNDERLYLNSINFLEKVFRHLKIFTFCPGKSPNAKRLLLDIRNFLDYLVCIIFAGEAVFFFLFKQKHKKCGLYFFMQPTQVSTLSNVVLLLLQQQIFWGFSSSLLQIQRLQSLLVLL